MEADSASWQAVPAAAHTASPATTGGGIIPYAFRVGVTGHRRLPDDPELLAQVDRALDRILELAPRASATPTRLTVISPLAEGADRLVAGRVLSRLGAALEVPLPLPKDDYLSDFATPESKAQFAALLGQADVVTELPHCEARDDAYEQVGRYVVERADILIALWDGLPPRGLGGTARVVEFARQRGMPVLWINTVSPYTLTEDQGNGLNANGLEKLNEYNRLHLEPSVARNEVDRLRAAAAPDIEAVLLSSAAADAF